MKNISSRYIRDYAMTILIVAAVLVIIASVYIHSIQALLPIATLLLALDIYLFSKDGNIRWVSGVLAFGFAMSTLSNLCWYLVPAAGFNDLVNWYYYYYVTGIFWLIGYAAIAYVLLQMIHSRQWYLEHRIDRMITCMGITVLFLAGMYVFLNMNWGSTHLIDIFVLMAYLCIDIIIVSTALKMALATHGELRYLALSVTTFFGINAIGDLLFETRWLFRLSNLMTVNLDRIELSFHFRDLIDITYNISLLIMTSLLFLFILDPFARRTLDEMRGRLKDTQLFVDDLIAKSPDATCIFDSDGRLVLVNDAFLQVFGLKRGDIDRSFNFFGWFSEQMFRDDVYNEVLKVRDRETVIIPKIKMAGMLGRSHEDYFYMYVKMFPTYGSDGRIVNYVLIIEDITERVRLEDDLFKAYNSLKAEYERKMDFTNAAAHELRTPLTPIIGYTDILKAEIEDERHLEFLEIIERNALRQKNLVNRMLELASLDAGMAHVSCSELDLRILANEIADNYRAINPDIRVEVPEGMLINTDSDILRHVLDNLVSNAVKYSDNDKEIVVKVTVSGDTYQFSVTDHGTGIPAHEWGKIFERFYIIGGDTDSRTSGRSGLGLALVKAYINLIGGHVWLESEPGKGSTFFFTVPGKPSSDGKSH